MMVKAPNKPKAFAKLSPIINTNTAIKLEKSTSDCENSAFAKLLVCVREYMYAATKERGIGKTDVSKIS